MVLFSVSCILKLETVAINSNIIGVNMQVYTTSIIIISIQDRLYKD